MSDQEDLQSRRDFLKSSGKWSGAAILAALLGGISNSPEASAGVWVNRRGGWINGGGSWINSNPGGSWVNRAGGWLNAGGGGGGWVNRRGGGSWINRR